MGEAEFIDVSATRGINKPLEFEEISNWEELAGFVVPIPTWEYRFLVRIGITKTQKRIKVLIFRLGSVCYSPVTSRQN